MITIQKPRKVELAYKLEITKIRENCGRGDNNGEQS